jgi:urease accessory protein
MTPDLPPARQLLRRADRLAVALPAARVTLGYDARFLRRKRLVTGDGAGFLVDLAETVSVDDGDCFVLTDGRLIEVLAAAEPVLVVTGDLPRLAWHIGNRHTPCEIGPDRLVIRQDHVLEAMLRQLGATVTLAAAPFRPEGGAYGAGRTLGHAHPACATDDAGHWHGDRFHRHGPE